MTGQADHQVVYRGRMARLVPFTVDGLIYAGSLVMLDSARGLRPAPRHQSGALAGLGMVNVTA